VAPSPSPSQSLPPSPGYRTAVRTTRMALDAPRGDWRWDKKAAAYLDAIAYLSDRRAKRQAHLNPRRLTREDEGSLDKYFASYKRAPVV
jgi:hypothetical protein